MYKLWNLSQSLRFIKYVICIHITNSDYEIYTDKFSWVGLWRAWKCFVLDWFSVEWGFCFHTVCICMVSSSSIFWIHLLIKMEGVSKLCLNQWTWDVVRFLSAYWDTILLYTNFCLSYLWWDVGGLWQVREKVWLA